MGLFVKVCGRQTVSPRFEARLISRPYRASAGHPFTGGSDFCSVSVPSEKDAGFDIPCAGKQTNDFFKSYPSTTVKRETEKGAEKKSPQQARQAR